MIAMILKIVRFVLSWKSRCISTSYCLLQNRLIPLHIPPAPFFTFSPYSSPPRFIQRRNLTHKDLCFQYSFFIVSIALKLTKPQNAMPNVTNHTATFIMADIAEFGAPLLPVKYSAAPPPSVIQTTLAG